MYLLRNILLSLYEIIYNKLTQIVHSEDKVDEITFGKEGKDLIAKIIRLTHNMNFILFIVSVCIFF